jgi:hypothetical protein
MEEEAQKFLEAEETAEKLVQSLEELHTEATAYDIALKELNGVRQDLVGLIDSTKQLASGSHEAIKTIRELGTPEILDRITSMQKTTSEEITTQFSDIQGNFNENIKSQFSDIQNKFSEELSAKTNALGTLKTLVTIAVVGSIGAIIVGVISLLK